jgi:hypothetical protein
MRRAMAVAMALMCVLASGCDLNPHPLPPSNDFIGSTGNGSLPDGAPAEVATATATGTSVNTASATGSNTTGNISSGSSSNPSSLVDAASSIGEGGASMMDASSSDATLEDSGGSDAAEDAPDAEDAADAGSRECVEGASEPGTEGSACADAADSSAGEDAWSSSSELGP